LLKPQPKVGWACRGKVREGLAFRTFRGGTFRVGRGGEEKKKSRLRGSGGKNLSTSEGGVVLERVRKFGGGGVRKEKSRVALYRTFPIAKGSGLGHGGTSKERKNKGETR